MEDEIDAVAMTRGIRDAQHEKLKNKGWEERLAFYKEQAQALHRELKERNSPEQGQREREGAA